jgi:ATP-dependent protease ClpP protease subunit
MSNGIAKIKAVVWIDDDIYTDAFAIFKESLKAYGAYTEIEVNIDSRGGVLSQGLAIHDFLEYQKKKGIEVTTIAWAKCASAATVIHLAGSEGKRLVANSNNYCIHEVMNGGALFGARANELIEWGQQIEKDNCFLAKIYATKTGNSEEEIRDWMRQDVFWDSKTTIERKFADSLLDAKGEGVNYKPLTIYDFKVGLNQKMKYEAYMQDSLGIARSEMPQIDKDLQDMFLSYFKVKYGEGNVAYTKTPANTLKPTQNEIDTQKVLEKLEGQNYKEREFLVSRENYLIDGHHDWAASLEDNERQLLNIVKIDLPIKALLKESNKLKLTYNEPNNVGIEFYEQLLFLSIYVSKNQ